jgi:hypothetical protein
MPPPFERDLPPPSGSNQGMQGWMGWTLAIQRLVVELSNAGVTILSSLCPHALKEAESTDDDGDGTTKPGG